MFSRVLASALHSFASLAAVLVVFDGSSTAQVASTYFHSNSLPRRSEHALVYDAASQQVLMLGGAPEGSFMAWTGQAWNPIPGPAPTSRRGAAMVCDRARSRVVLFGGWDDNTGSYPSDVWEWDGQSWSQHVTPGPVGRQGHAMAYDSNRGRTVLFGGRGSMGLLGDTWEWTGIQWMPRFAPVNPSVRSDAAMAFDVARGAVVMFGGYAAGGETNQTWFWNGSNWSSAGVFGVVPGRRGASMVFDPQWQTCVVLGGTTSSGSIAGLQILQGTQWVAVNFSFSASSPAGAGAMAFDEARKQCVFASAVQGFNSMGTWTVDGNVSAASGFGSGCGQQAATLVASSVDAPVIGRTAQIAMQGAALDFGFLAIGTSKFWMGGFPLPIALDGLGMPGCGILQSLDIHSSYPSSSGAAGVANFSLPIPPNIFLLGAELHLQAWAPDPAANTAGIVLTNGVTWTIGDF